MNIYRFSRRIVCPFNRYLVLVLTTLVMTVSPANAAPADAPLITAQFFDAVLAERDRDVAAAIVSADAPIHTPEGEFTGHAGAGQFATSLSDSFSKLVFVTQEPALAGDLVTVRWTMTGVHTGDYQSLVPIGAPVALDGLAILRFDDAVIVEQWIVYDRLALVEQIKAFTPHDSCDADCLKPTGNR